MKKYWVAAAVVAVLNTGCASDVNKPDGPVRLPAPSSDREQPRSPNDESHQRRAPDGPSYRCLPGYELVCTG